LLSASSYAFNIRASPTFGVNPFRLRHLGNIKLSAFSLRLIPEQKRAPLRARNEREIHMLRQNDVTSESGISFSRKPAVSRCSPGVAAKLMVAFALLGLASASAAVITFDVVGGTLADGSTFTGTITVDNMAGTVTATNITFAGPDAPDTCSGAPSSSFPFPPHGYFISISCAPGATPLVLILQSDPLGDLLGYTGGPISLASSLLFPAPAPPVYVTGGVLVPAPAVSDSAFQVRYAANLNLGESYIDITNTGANGDSLLGPGFGTTQAGNICVNVYAFDPSEEMIACCSCLVTPDQTVSLGVNADLTVKTLTGVPETSVTVKLLASLNTTTPLGGVPGVYGCTNSAATVVTGTVASGTNTVALFGMAAWGTTLHTGTTAGSSSVTTETPFTPATLSSGAAGSNNELQSLTGRCAAIIGNASGYGICTSCQSGALGGKKL
jgi:hypothetical protein